MNDGIRKIISNLLSPLEKNKYSLNHKKKNRFLHWLSELPRDVGIRKNVNINLFH